MAKLAFLGLGQMGTPMAARLLDAGHDLTIWNRTSAKAEPLVAQGAAAAPTPADAVTGADAVITMLANPPALEQVVFGDEGIVGALSPGQWLIDMSAVGWR